MADERRRAGDWTHKEQRKRANAALESQGPQVKWYRQTFWIVFFLILFWPVGIVLAWRSDWPIAGKVVATVLIALCVAMSLYMRSYVSQLQTGF